MSNWVLVLIVVLVLVAAGFGIWAFLRHRYVEALRAKGWEFITSPDISIAYGLNVPPFGMGFGRSVDDQLIGTASDATPFSAFRYKTGGWRTSGYAVVMPLPFSLPPGAVTRPDIQRELDLGAPVEGPGAVASSPDPGYAQQLLSAIGPTLRGAYRIGVDHGHITLVDAPKDPDELQAAIEQLAASRAALLSSPAAQVQGPPAPPALSFYERPHWSYLPRDDSFLRMVNYTGGGYAHEAHDIIHSENGGVPFIRLRHTWKTDHTETDSEGNTRTRTENHTEYLCEFATTFPFKDVSVNWGLFGRKQEFEWTEFNRRFAVRTGDQRFGSDIIHQRQMEYMMAFGAPKFEISGSRIRVGGGNEWGPADIDRASAFLHGFFARVPDFVWQNLGAWPRPIAEITAGPPT